MAGNIPVKLEGMALFMEGSNTDFATGDITLPSLTPMSDTISGAGILGEVDLPSPGHYGSMELGIAWRTINKDAFRLVGSQTKGLEIRGAFKEFDKAQTAFVTRAIKIVVRGVGKGMDLGTLSVNATTDTTNTIEATYLKIFIDGETVFELDKFNYISRVNGEDDQADVRKALGMA
ncbi:phage major tail tube protein [Paenibacillus sp. SAF-054]|uniref:phage major tail tube protein n=1 Tax=unclassified Paenibacillus TaxID=185978 RepID=UPI003F813598